MSACTCVCVCVTEYGRTMDTVVQIAVSGRGRRLANATRCVARFSERA